MYCCVIGRGREGVLVEMVIVVESLIVVEFTFYCAHACVCGQYILWVSHVPLLPPGRPGAESLEEGGS